MSSRPPMGVPQRQPPSRSLSSSSTLSSQRPANRRTRSSQHISPSPTRNNSADLSADATSQTNNAAQTQYGTPRRGGSRLRLELPNDGITHSGSAESPTSANALELPKSSTPSRAMPPATTGDVSDPGDVSSPRAPGHVQTADKGNNKDNSKGNDNGKGKGNDKGNDNAKGNDNDNDNDKNNNKDKDDDNDKDNDNDQDNDNDNDNDNDDENDSDNTPLPMPMRRPRFAVPDARKCMAPPAPPPAKKDNRPKPYTVEVPPAAPRYRVLNNRTDLLSKSGNTNAQPTAYSDFTPWLGDGPEDHFTQTFIQTGFFDKNPVAQAETSSAKGAIFPAIKHKSGLQALSTVFTGILASRRQNGQITSASTFKPPPRVTLTDTKREAWLKDLANSGTSLRRLSRTIPHGIRGKGLLEQCLNKNVPTDRAVWLAKCVGANEIRAFKRKGVNGAIVMGGEAKWIRDWTIFVEQFVDAVVSSFGDVDWKHKVNYAIRLATHLYAEHLLDREHYMDWLISSLENCPQSKLPMWLLIIQIYWRKLVKFRKYGRRLIDALLGQHTKIHNNPDHDIFAPLSSRLLKLLKLLMTSCATNFLSPATWTSHREALLSALPLDDEMVQAAYRWIDLGNEQLISSMRAPPAARHVIVETLDGMLQTPMLGDAPTTYWITTKDRTNLVRTTLEWGTSIYRPGIAKVYVVHRLLSTWTSLGLDATLAILDFMNSDPLEELDRKTALYHLVTELVLSGSFDTLRYVQWLIARGGLHDPNSVTRNGPASSRLLVELPASALPPSLASMRANMLGRAAYSVHDEVVDQEMAIDCVKGTLGLHWGGGTQTTGMPIGKLSKRISLSSRALKAEIGQFIRRAFVPSLDAAQMATKDGFQLPSPIFIAVRSILEAAEDFQTLAQFLKTSTGFPDADILASCADTLNLHLHVFGALGAANEMFDTLVTRLETLRQMQGVAGVRSLLISVAMLAPRLPGQEALVAYLNDTIRNDRSSAVDASSPVSDNMATRIQDKEGELLDEIEKKLANKTSMDRTTMYSFLNKIIPKVEACWSKTDERLRAYGLLLTRLRHFDAQHFDSFMTKWVLGIRNPQNRPPVSHIFPLMISVGCLDLSIILATTSDAVSTTGRINPAAKAAGLPHSTYIQEVLELLTAPPVEKELLTPEELYRFTILQNQAPTTHLKEMAALARNALAEYCACLSRRDSQGPPLASHLATTGPPLANPQAWGRLLCLLRTLVLKDQVAVSKILSTKTADPAVGRKLDVITTQLLFPSIRPGIHITLDQVLGLANDFTLPFCQLKLAQGLGSSEASATSDQDRQQSQLEVFAKAMDNAIEARNITWTGMLPTLSPEITQHLLNRAQTRLFDLLPSKDRSTSPAPNFVMAQSLLSVIETISRGEPVGSRTSLRLTSATVDRLADLWELLATPSDPDVKVPILVSWLPLMLNFLALQAQTHDIADKQSNEVRGLALLVLAGILQEVDNLASLAVGDLRLPSKLIVSLSRRVFDLSLSLVDDLSDEARQQCIRILRDAVSDSRLRYIFSAAPPPMENLMLAHKDKPPAQPPQPGQQQQRPRVTTFLGVGAASGNLWGTPVGPGGQSQEKLSSFTFKRWEILNEPTPIVGENDTSLSLTLFDAFKLR